ncbi:hypothetical protein Tco_0175909, partial [Tanacetum coccineum]
MTSDLRESLNSIFVDLIKQHDSDEDIAEDYLQEEELRLCLEDKERLYCWVNEFHQDKASSVKVPAANFTLQSSVQLLRENTDLVRLNQRMRPTTPSVPLKLKGWQLINSL